HAFTYSIKCRRADIRPGPDHTTLESRWLGAETNHVVGAAVTRCGRTAGPPEIPALAISTAGMNSAGGVMKLNFPWGRRVQASSPANTPMTGDDDGTS